MRTGNTADEELLKNSAKRGRKPAPYIMWLCYHLACVVDEDTELLPQHKQLDGGYTKVGDRLCLSPEAVEYHVRNAQKLRDTAKGMQEYNEWLTKRERKWWCYHAVCIEQRELKLLEYVGEMEGDNLVLTRGDVHITPKEAEALVNEAQTLRNPENARGEEDYRAWLAWYEKRVEKGKAKPLVYRSLSTDDPAALVVEERRAVKGLRNGLTKAGRKRKHAI